MEFYMKDVRNIYRETPNAVVQDWIKKGLLSCTVQEVGNRTYFQFSAAQILHAGVLGQLSQLGVLRFPLADVLVWFDPGRGADETRGAPEPKLLSQPGRFLEFYAQHTYEVAIAVTQTPTPRPSKADRRRKQQVFSCLLHLMPYSQIADAFCRWHDSEPVFQTTHWAVISVPSLVSRLKIGGISV